MIAPAAVRGAGPPRGSRGSHVDHRSALRRCALGWRCQCLIVSVMTPNCSAMLNREHASSLGPFSALRKTGLAPLGRWRGSGMLRLRNSCVSEMTVNGFAPAAGHPRSLRTLTASSFGPNCGTHLAASRGTSVASRLRGDHGAATFPVRVNPFVHNGLVPVHAWLASTARPSGCQADAMSCAPRRASVESNPAQCSLRSAHIRSTGGVNFPARLGSGLAGRQST